MSPLRYSKGYSVVFCHCPHVFKRHSNGCLSLSSSHKREREEGTVGASTHPYQPMWVYKSVFIEQFLYVITTEQLTLFYLSTRWGARNLNFKHLHIMTIERGNLLSPNITAILEKN